MIVHRRARIASIVVAALFASACTAGEGKEDESREHEREESKAVVSTDADDITPAMIALGDSIFHGKIGASSCQACHGVGGQNGTAAPNLTDAEWLHSDGSLDGIYKTVKSGVMAPKQFSSVMPPYGGVMLTEDKTIAVAAYVYSLAHK